MPPCGWAQRRRCAAVSACRGACGPHCEARRKLHRRPGRGPCAAAGQREIGNGQRASGIGHLSTCHRPMSTFALSWVPCKRLIGWRWCMPRAGRRGRCTPGWAAGALPTQARANQRCGGRCRCGRVTRQRGAGLRGGVGRQAAAGAAQPHGTNDGGPPCGETRHTASRHAPCALDRSHAADPLRVEAAWRVRWKADQA